MRIILTAKGMQALSGRWVHPGIPAKQKPLKGRRNKAQGDRREPWIERMRESSPRLYSAPLGLEIRGCAPLDPHQNSSQTRHSTAESQRRGVFTLRPTAWEAWLARLQATLFLSLKRARSWHIKPVFLGLRVSLSWR